MFIETAERHAAVQKSNIKVRLRPRDDRRFAAKKVELLPKKYSESNHMHDCPEAAGGDANLLVQLCLSDVLWRVPKRRYHRRHIRNKSRLRGWAKYLKPLSNGTMLGTSSHLVILHDFPNSAERKDRSSRYASSSLLMGSKSYSGLDIVGDTFGWDIQNWNH